MRTFVLVSSLDTTRPALLLMLKMTELNIHPTALLTYSDVLEVLTVAPEEGEAVQVHIALHGEPLQPPVDQSQVSIVIIWTNHRSVLEARGPITGQY